MAVLRSRETVPYRADCPCHGIECWWRATRVVHEMTAEAVDFDFHGYELDFEIECQVDDAEVA